MAVTSSKSGYPTRETADIVVDRVGDLEDGFPCRLKSAEHEDWVDCTLEEAIAYVMERCPTFIERLVRANIIDFWGVAVTKDPPAFRGHVKKPDVGMSIYDD